MGERAELPPAWGCYPEVLPALCVVVGMENVSCMTVVQDRGRRSSLSLLGNAVGTVSSNCVLQMLLQNRVSGL